MTIPEAGDSRGLPVSSADPIEVEKVILDRIRIAAEAELSPQVPAIWRYAHGWM